MEILWPATCGYPACLVVHGISLPLGLSSGSVHCLTTLSRALGFLHLHMSYVRILCCYSQLFGCVADIMPLVGCGIIAVSEAAFRHKLPGLLVEARGRSGLQTRPSSSSARGRLGTGPSLGWLGLARVGSVTWGKKCKFSTSFSTKLVGNMFFGCQGWIWWLHVTLSHPTLREWWC